MDLHKHQLALMTDSAYRRADTQLERAEMLIRARVNPFSDRTQITQAQSESLGRMLTRLRTRFDGEPAMAWQQFRAQGRFLLQRSTDAATAGIIEAENKEDTRAYYRAHGKLTHQPSGTPDAERTSQRKPGSWAPRPRTVTATGDMRTLYQSFDRFTKVHDLSVNAIGAACIGKLTQEPLDGTSVSNALSQLALGKAVAAPFRYMAKEPDKFFGALEKYLQGRNGGGDCTIGADERRELCQAAEAAIRQHTEQHGRRRR